MRSALLVLGIPLVSLACTADSPTRPQPSAAYRAAAAFASSTDEAGNSGCYTVQGTISESGFFPDFTGTVSGDLVGASHTTLTGALFTGAAVHNPGERTLTITGGTIPQLVGVTLHETFEGISIFEAHPLIRINERTRIDGGAQSGNLTTHGTVDLASSPQQFIVDYRGVICP